MITLKHLAQEFELDPYKLRQELRKNLKHKHNQRWQWEPKNPQLAQARKIAERLKHEIPSA